MSFDTYFAKSEEAFEEEMRTLLGRVDSIGEQWGDIAKTDEQTVQLVRELNLLKNLLRKGHLQILRTKEECLHMKLRNSQLDFHVRQLQSEIKRFLPFTHKEEPSIEYHLTIDKSKLRHKEEKKIEADDKLKEQIEKIRKEWKDILEMQEKVFSEEKVLQAQDDLQFQQFADDYNKQNQATHKLLDQIHEEMLKKLLTQQNQSKQQISAKETSLSYLKKRIQRLEDECGTINQKLNDKLEKAKLKMNKDFDKTKAAINDAVRMQEAANASLAIEAQKYQNAYEEELDELQYRISKHKKHEKRMEKRSDFAFNGSIELINKLESQMNALISAAAAVESLPNEHALNVISCVSSAVDANAKVSNDAEMIMQRLYNLKQRLDSININLQ